MTDQEEHTPQQSPEPLGEWGQKLWDEVTEEYELRPDELRILASACRMSDHIKRIEAELQNAPLIVQGSMKQPVAQPLLAELRQYRTAQSSLFKQLKLLDLDDEDEHQDEPTTKREGPMSRSESARIAANTRWAKAKGKRK